MTHIEREVFIRKLIDQKQKEHDEMEKAKAEAKAKSSSSHKPSRRR